MNSFLGPVNQIAERLRAVAQAQHLIEEAATGYSDYYRNRVKHGYTQPEYIPYLPDEVQMQFWRQIIYFRCGPFAGPHTPYPYIDTWMRMYAAGKYFGDHVFLSLMNGTYDDDITAWRTELVKTLQELPDWPQYPVDEFETVPEHLRDIFPQLNSIVETQALEHAAELRCGQWFAEHPDWDQNYPQSLLEAPHPREAWFRDRPDWFQMYPKRPFPPKKHKIMIGFNRLLFCFNHNEYPDPHFLTRLRIYAGRYEIGGYTLATQSDGKVIEKFTGIYPYPYTY